MLNIGFFRGQPTEFVIRYSGGRVRASGQGLTFFFPQHSTQIVVVPTSTRDAGFVFNEVSSDFQEVTIQGQFTYRISAPEQAAEQFNFTIDPRRRKHLSDDLDVLPQRIINIIQTETRADVRRRSLEEVLRDAQAIAVDVLTRVQTSGVLAPMGVELMHVHFLSAKPTPEVAKALEAGYREALLRRADEAVYARRAAAVEEERKIKENELSTDIALEQRREQYINLQGENLQREAEFRGKAMEQESAYRARAMELEAGARIKSMEMEAEVAKDMPPARILALAIRELGSNADRIVAALSGEVQQS